MRQSIFGETMRGVPSPYVPHRHPYPTRYHGPVYNTPEFRNELRWRPYYVPPGLAASPDGIGAVLPGLTRSAVADAVIGAVVGWFGAPTRREALVYGIAGGAAAGIAGGVGLGALVAYELYQSQLAGGLRKDLHRG